MSIEAMKMAIGYIEEALTSHDQKYGDHFYMAKDRKKIVEDLTALRQAIEQAQKQEPVAWVSKNALDYVVAGGYVTTELNNRFCDVVGKPTPLYTEPPQREWVGLTDEDFCEAWAQSKGDVLFRLWPFARAIAAKLKEKNHG